MVIIMGRITTLLLKLPITKVVIKINIKRYRFCNYNVPERDECVTIVITVMITFNKGVVIRPIDNKVWITFFFFLNDRK
jgi:hypothetical protein